MRPTRRAFISRSSLFVAGAWFGLASPHSASAGIASTKTPVPLTSADEAVLQWVRTYATDLRLVGSGLLGRLRGKEKTPTHIVARVETIDLLSGAFSSAFPLPDAKVYAEGNTLTVQSSVGEFTVENLLPSAFAEALTTRLARRNTRFASDALVWDPATGALSDPYRAVRTRSLKLVAPGAGAVADFRALLRSYTEADTAAAEFDRSFKAYQWQVLTRPIAGRKYAAEITTELLGQLPNLAGVRSAMEIRTILVSPLVSSALKKQLGLNARILADDFQASRLQEPASVPDAAIWLALLLGARLQDGTATALVSTVSPAQQATLLAALREASTLL